MKKLILFIHGLGGDEETWGKFPELISSDENLKKFDVKIYTYPTSLIRVKSIIKPFSSILSYLMPQEKLPSIQDIAKGLKTEIDNRYRVYDDIYLVAHSMGGLIAKKFLLDEVNQKQHNTKINKLLLYAVPNHGSNWAILSKLYDHVQIKQLSKDSDFIESLNTDIAKSNLMDYVSIKYVIASQDEVVDKRSAQNDYGDANQETIHCGHMDIVKPKDSEDLSYKILKNYILDKWEPKITDESIDYMFKDLVKKLLEESMNKNREYTDNKLNELKQSIKG